MRQPIPPLLPVLLGLLSACGDVGITDQWGYSGETGPAHWAELVTDSQCGGNAQSPIDIIAVDATADTSSRPLDIHYADSTRISEVTNNGHTIQYNFEKGDYVNFAGRQYALQQIHFHESSEHTLNGVRYPMVIHMVHTSPAGDFLVVAVMAQEGKGSAPFDFLERYLPLAVEETKPVHEHFDLNDNLPAERGYFHYTGSLTTPPCTEGVDWFVFREPITVSKSQIRELQALMPLNNYRNEQALNHRIVTFMQ